MNPIEERVAKLEEAVFGDSEPGRNEWQSTVGMFRGDPVMKEILDDVHANREQEREKARSEKDGNE